MNELIVCQNWSGVTYFPGQVVDYRAIQGFHRLIKSAFGYNRCFDIGWWICSN